MLFVASLLLACLVIFLLWPRFFIAAMTLIGNALELGFIELQKYFTQKVFLPISCLLGLLAVLLGAFGTHSLKNVLSPKMIEIYKTANLYHFFHSIMAAILSFQLQYSDSQLLKISILFFIIGIFIFSGSLYLLAVTGYTRLGMITPVGGSLFILAWFLLFCFSLKYSS